MVARLRLDSGLEAVVWRGFFHGCSGTPPDDSCLQRRYFMPGRRAWRLFLDPPPKVNVLRGFLPAGKYAGSAKLGRCWVRRRYAAGIYSCVRKRDHTHRELPGDLTVGAGTGNANRLRPRKSGPNHAIAEDSGTTVEDSCVGFRHVGCAGPCRGFIRLVSSAG